MCAKWLLLIYIFIGIDLIRSHDNRISINVKDFDKNGKLIFTHVVCKLGNISTFDTTSENQVTESSKIPKILS